MNKVRFEGVILIEEKDSQGDVIDIDGCDISELENSSVFKHMDSRNIEDVVGQVVGVQGDVSDGGKKLVRVSVDLYDFPDDLEYDVPVGAFGFVLEKHDEHRLTKTAIKGMAIVGHPVHPAYVLKRVKRS